MRSLLYPARPAKDSRWFEQIQPYIDELYITLGIPHQQLASLQAEFEEAPFNPDLRPLHLDPAVYEQRNRELTAMKERLDSEESDEAVRLAYGLKIEELTKQNRLLIAAIEGDHTALSDLNRWLFGAANPDYFAGACAWIRQMAESEYDSSVGHISAAAKAVLDTVPTVPGSVDRILPDAHVFKHVRDSHFAPGGYFETLLDGATVPEIVTPVEGDPLTEAAIRSVGSQYQLKDSTDYLWGVIHSDHAVVRPVGYNLSRAAFIGIVSHEIGSHLLERENGLRQALQLLSVGLDRYESSNEGRAFLREQIQFHSPYDMMSEASWEHIILLYISSALGDGIYQRPYDFTSLYQVVYSICRLFKARRMPDNPVMAEHHAKEEAWQLTTRAAKGTDGTGGAFNKGMVYLSGNLQAWQLAATDPDIIFLGDAGKFDISRRDHRDILTACEIIRLN